MSSYYDNADNSIDNIDSQNQDITQDINDSQNQDFSQTNSGGLGAKIRSAAQGLSSNTNNSNSDSWANQDSGADADQADDNLSSVQGLFSQANSGFGNQDSNFDSQDNSFGSQDASDNIDSLNSGNQTQSNIDDSNW